MSAHFKFATGLVICVAVLTTVQTRASNSALSEAGTAGQICTNCLSSTGSDQGAPLSSRNLKMIKITVKALRSDITAKNECLQIVNSRECQNLYAKITKAGHQLNQFKRDCSDTQYDRNQIAQALATIFLGANNSVSKKLHEEDVGFVKGVGKSVYNGVKSSFEWAGKSIGQTAGWIVTNHECNAHIQSKKILYESLNADLPKGYKLTHVTDQALNNYSCNNIKEAYRMNMISWRAHNGVYKSTDPTAVDEEIQGIARGMLALTEKNLKKFRIQYECYNSKKQGELIGAAFGTIALNVAPGGDAAEAAELAYDARKIGKIAGLGKELDDATPLVTADNPQFRAIYAKAPAAKIEIDRLADKVAAENSGTAAKVRLKDEDRALKKINNNYSGKISRLKDVARNTVVVPKDRIQSAIDAIEAVYPDAKINVVTSKSNPRGWSMVNATIPTKAGIPAEIQINSPEMIYAGFKESEARSILGDSTYNAIEKRVGMRGGLSHILYEQVRTLPDANPRKTEVEDLCRQYHDIVRQGASGMSRSAQKTMIKNFDTSLAKYIRTYDSGDRQLMNMGAPLPGH